ncbi:hypothetical protein CBR_g55409 [Chara braunii]|uniref:Uncharacterized protein n=1 Tax=Chara braunii TaxID=69332 RepID=A0A388K7R4_CHABU|nr:hypothetical protein CBR_g55409 [Chara braunii]|eukprot:GBG66066.1 hypothetical protein CBR_g55409 [Chara braunii]
MRPIGVEATPAADVRGTADTRDRTGMDIGTTDMRGRVEMATEGVDMREEIGTGGVDMREEIGTGGVDMREEIGTGNDKKGHVDGLSAGEKRESSATGREDGTTEGTDAMSHEDTMTRGTGGMTREDSMSKEGLEETGTTIRAVGMREWDMVSHQNHIQTDDLGDVSMFSSMKENIEAKRIKTSKGMEPVRGQSIKITFEGDMAATKSARGSTSKKTDTDYVMAEKDGQRVDGEEVILSPRKRGVKKFLMKSSLDEIDTVEPLRRALRQPMQCSILKYLAASKPARDELQMITRKTRIPLSENDQRAPKAEASTVAVTGVTARADRMASVLLDGMEGVPPDKFYILGSGAVETIINDGAVLDAVIDNGSEAVIIDEDLAVQVGLGLDRSYLFEIETTDGRKQQITGREERLEHFPEEKPLRPPSSYPRPVPPKAPKKTPKRKRRHSSPGAQGSRISGGEEVVQPVRTRNLDPVPGSAATLVKETVVSSPPFPRMPDLNLDGADHQPQQPQEESEWDYRIPYPDPPSATAGGIRMGLPDPVSRSPVLAGPFHFRQPPQSAPIIDISSSSEPDGPPDKGGFHGGAHHHQA